MFKRSLASVVILFIALAAAIPVFSVQAEGPVQLQPATRDDEQRKARFHELMQELEKRSSKFNGEAGILVKDLNTGQTIGLNSSKLFPSASLVKVPIMAALYQAQAEGKLSIDDELVLQRKHKVRSASHLYFVKTGTKLTIRNLIERMITESDNTATNVLVDALGFSYINEKFASFGLKNTDLRRNVLDLVWRNAGIENYTTAEDMALILNKIYSRQLVSEQASDEMMAVLKRQKVNDRLPTGLPHTLEVAHKTGSLHDTVSDCGIVFTPEGDFIICVITADINNLKRAKKFIGTIANCTYGRCYKKDIN